MATLRAQAAGTRGRPAAPASADRPAALPEAAALARPPHRHARRARARASSAGFADNDAGGITTYSLVGAKFGYALLWVILASQVVLFFTQEVGARLGLATGKGLISLIRERWGVRWTVFAALLMLAANLGSTVAEFAGIGSALGIFGVPPQISAAVAAVVVVGFITLGSYGRVQYLFVAIGIGVSAAYVFSAFQANPDWSEASRAWSTPSCHRRPPTGSPSSAPSARRSPPGARPSSSPTSPTRACDRTTSGQPRRRLLGRPAHERDRRLHPHRLCGHALRQRVTITTAGRCRQGTRADRGPCGRDGVRVRPARRLVPGPRGRPDDQCLHHREAFGWETGVDWNWREAPAFYGLLAFFIGFAALFVMIPGLPLIQVMFLAQVLNALLLPFILVFVMLLASDVR